MSRQQPQEDGGDCIKIFLRVRPSTSDNSHTCLQVNSSTEVTLKVHCPKVFQFDDVADEKTSQETVFNRVGQQIVESCIEGYNGTIFAYGQTGSGKTYTMIGPGEDNIGSCTHDLRGVIPRSLEYLFELIRRKQVLHGREFEFECKASFLEIYNEQIYDLLDQYNTRPLQLRESVNRGVFVEGIAERSVASSHEAFNVLMEGWCNRRVASTSMNRESSRSHAVFTLTVEMKEQTASGTKIRKSVLNLVDLAGSERQRDTHASGIQLREAGKINGSLSVLGQVIMALGDIANNKTRHVPYRNSKLTFLLRDSLGGNAKTHIIINVHPNMQYFGETTSTLLFAQRAKQIRNRARVNENLQGNVNQLQNEVKRLKAQLARYEQPAVPNNSDDNVFVQDDWEFRDKFYQAMQMLDSQGKLVSSLKKQIGKMDKANMSRKFIIKLRNSTIDSLKSGKTITKDEDVEALKKELEILREQFEHHPEIGAYQTKVTELQNEVDHMQQMLRPETLQEQQKQLQDMFVTLLGELEPDRSLLRRDSVLNDSTVLSLMVTEADRSRIAELEEKLQSKAQEADELKEKNSALEAELTSSKKNIQELEAFLKNTREESSVHVKALNKMHESTLRTITTPIKSNLDFSSNDGPSPAKISRLNAIPLGNLVDISSPGDDEPRDVPSLMDQSMPQVMEEVVHEALQEELQQVMEEMEKFREESIGKEQELVSLRQSQAATEERLSNLTQRLTELREENSILQEQWGTLTNEKQIVDLEVRDFKILLKSADREHLDTKKKNESIVESLKQRISANESSFFELQNNFCALEDEKENAIREAQALSADCEKQKIELAFFKQQLEDVSNDLRKEEEKYQDLDTQLLDVKDALKREIANSNSLRDQLEGKTKEVSEELLALRNAKAELEKTIMGLREETTSKITELEMKFAELEETKRRKKEAETAVVALRAQVTELRGSNSMLEIVNGGLHSEFDELMTKFNQSVADLEREKENMEELIKEREIFVTNQEKHAFELESLQEDLFGYSEHYEALEGKLKTATTSLDLERETINLLQNELQEQNELVLKAKETERLAKDRETCLDDLRKKLEEATSKYSSCQEKLLELEELKKVRQEKQELMTENARLAGHSNHLQKIQYLSKMKNKLETVEAENSRLNVELRRIEVEIKKYDPTFRVKRLSGVNSSRPREHRPLEQQDSNKN